MSGITRTTEVTVADAWANDDGEVTIEVSGNLVSLSIVEAATYALTVADAALDASRAQDEKDAELAVQQMRDRMVASQSGLDDLESGRDVRQKWPCE